MRLMARKTWQAAFSTTVVALLFTIAGWAGYAVKWHGVGPFGVQTGSPVLWEIGLGTAFAVAAVVNWRRALRSF
jgi:hypothetical protein